MPRMKHNHFTRDIKPLGQCPGCDDYHRFAAELNAETNAEDEEQDACP